MVKQGRSQRVWADRRSRTVSMFVRHMSSRFLALRRKQTMWLSALNRCGVRMCLCVCVAQGGCWC